MQLEKHVESPMAQINHASQKFSSCAAYISVNFYDFPITSKLFPQNLFYKVKF